MVYFRRVLILSLSLLFHGGHYGIIYPVSVDPYSIQVRHPRVCKGEAHWLVVKLVIPGPMSFVLTYSVRSYLDTLGVHANWIDYTFFTHSYAPHISQLDVGRMGLMAPVGGSYMCGTVEGRPEAYINSVQ